MHDQECPDEEILSAFSEGQLDDDSLNVVASHVLNCSTCQSALEQQVAQPSAPLLARVSRYSASNTSPNIGQLCREAVARAASLNTVGGVGSAETRELWQSANSDDQPQFIGNYRILGLLGTGGMGAVYRALHTGLDKVMAIKLLPAHHTGRESAVQRFKREMKAVGKVHHPNIVSAFDAGEADGIHYLVMEFVPGLNLLQILERNGPLSVPAACELIRQASLGLDHAWRRGLIHRDIKPSNLMLTLDEAGRPLVKILDLGLALSSDLLPVGPDVDSNGDLTSCGQIMGTLDYIAPEQIRNSHAVDVRADVYSLGVTLFKLLTNTTPFSRHNKSANSHETATQAEEAAPSIATRRPGLPAELVQIVARLLATLPEARPDSPGEVARLLAPFTQAADLSGLLPQETLADRSSGVPVLSPPSDSNRAQSTSPRDSVPPHHAATFRRRAGWLLACAALLLTSVLLGQTIFIQSPYGMIIVELNDPRLKVTIGQQDFSIDNNGQQIEFAPGVHALQIRMGDLVFKSEKFTLQNGNTEAFHVRMIPGEIQVVRGTQTFGKWPLSSLRSADHTAASTPTIHTDPHRKLAHWLILHKSGFGCMTKLTRDNHWEVFRLDQIPEEPFEINSLFLNAEHTEEIQQLIEMLAGKIPLHHLVLSTGGKRGVIVAETLQQVARVNSLQSLNLRSAPDLVAADFEVLKTLPRLFSLNVENMPVDEEVIQRVLLLPRLTHLLMNECEITDSSLLPLRNSKIQTLYLNTPHLTDQACTVFAEMPHLQDLRILNSPGFTGAGLAKLQNQPLYKLSLERLGLKDAALQHLQNFPKLEILELRQNGLTDAGMQSLTDLPLLILEIEEPQVSLEMIRQLQQSLPRCQITSHLYDYKSRP